MAEPFDSNDPGDETRRYGDYIDVTAGEQLYGGEAVTLADDGSGNIVANRVGSAVEEAVVGYVYNPAASGDNVTIKTGGIGIAKVSSGAVAGDTVGSPTTSPGDSAHSQGELSADGDEYAVRELGSKVDPRAGDGSTASYAEVFRR